MGDVYVLELGCFRADPSHLGALRRCGGPLLAAMRRRFPGLRRMLLARLGDGRWLQLAFWDDRRSAEVAAQEMFDMPEMSDWLAQMSEFAEAA